MRTCGNNKQATKWNICCKYLYPSSPLCFQCIFIMYHLIRCSIYYQLWCHFNCPQIQGVPFSFCNRNLSVSAHFSFYIINELSKHWYIQCGSRSELPSKMCRWTKLIRPLPWGAHIQTFRDEKQNEWACSI